MSLIAQQAVEMLDILPETEQNFALEFIKRLVLAWDPDFTKVTPVEAESLRIADDEYERGDVVRMEDIDWN